MEIQSIDVTD